MKISVVILVILLTCNSLLAQIGRNITNTPPIIPEKSVLFANDVILDDHSDRDQRNLAICSAFNGWLYAIYSYYVSNVPQIAILRSKDDGLSWDLLSEGPFGVTNSIIKRLTLASAGTSISTFKIYFGYVLTNSNGTVGSAQVLRYKGEPFTGEGPLFYSSDNILDINISTDNFYTPTNSNPFCFAMVYSKHVNDIIGDSLIFQSSSSGGLLDNYRQVTTSTGHFGNLQLAYGKGTNPNSGRFYVAWEEKDSQSSVIGHIYTAHTEPTYTGTFTNPICLDCSDPSISNKCRRPSIACQYGNLDNDSSNITSMILFEHYLQSDSKFHIKGYYSRNSTVSGSYDPLTLTTSTNNNQQPDIAFNPFDSTFIVTYFDSTEQKLPYLTNNYNLHTPSSWNIISNGYNDSSNLKAPYPKVKLSVSQQAGANVWIDDNTNGNGIALFDAPFHYPVGISENKTSNVKIYPNPSNGNFTIENIPQDQPLFIADMMGKIVLFRTTTEKRMNLNLNVPGVYLLKIGELNTKVVIEKE